MQFFYLFFLDGITSQTVAIQIHKLRKLDKLNVDFISFYQVISKKKYVRAVAHKVII